MRTRSTCSRGNRRRGIVRRPQSGGDGPRWPARRSHGRPSTARVDRASARRAEARPHCGHPAARRRGPPSASISLNRCEMYTIAVPVLTADPAGRRRVALPRSSRGWPSARPARAAARSSTARGRSRRTAAARSTTAARRVRGGDLRPDSGELPLRLGLHPPAIQAVAAARPSAARVRGRRCRRRRACR